MNLISTPPMTISEKVLARTCGNSHISPGEIVNCKVDKVMSHESTLLVIKHFMETGADTVWDPNKIIIPLDHRVPAYSVKVAEAHKKIREFVREQKIKNFLDKITIHLPILGEIYIQSFLVYFLRSVSMLLEGGVRLVPAIRIAKSSIKNNCIASQVGKLEQDVCAGSSLSQSMIDYGGKLFPQDLVAIVKVGEESALLHIMLERAACLGI